MLIATTALVIFGAASNSGGPLVRVDGHPESFCGHLGRSDSGKTEIIGTDGSIHQIAIAAVKSIQPTSSC
jgi:hypothetical protein